MKFNWSLIGPGHILTFWLGDKKSPSETHLSPSDSILVITGRHNFFAVFVSSENIVNFSDVSNTVLYSLTLVQWDYFYCPTQQAGCIEHNWPIVQGTKYLVKWFWLQFWVFPVAGSWIWWNIKSVTTDIKYHLPIEWWSHNFF